MNKYVERQLKALWADYERLSTKGHREMARQVKQRYNSLLESYNRDRRFKALIGA